MSATSHLRLLGIRNNIGERFEIVAGGQRAALTQASRAGSYAARHPRGSFTTNVRRQRTQWTCRMSSPRTVVGDRSSSASSHRGHVGIMPGESTISRMRSASARENIAGVSVLESRLFIRVMPDINGAVRGVTSAVYDRSPPGRNGRHLVRPVQSRGKHRPRQCTSGPSNSRGPAPSFPIVRCGSPDGGSTTISAIW